MVHGLSVLTKLNAEKEKRERSKRVEAKLANVEQLRKRIEGFRHRLTIGLPPLTLQEQRELFFLATGDFIPDRKRCEGCDANGHVKFLGMKRVCRVCAGVGYKVEL